MSVIRQHGGPVVGGGDDSKEETTFYITLTIERDDEDDEEEEEEEEEEDEYEATSSGCGRPDGTSTGMTSYSSHSFMSNDDSMSINSSSTSGTGSKGASAAGPTSVRGAIGGFKDIGWSGGSQGQPVRKHNLVSGKGGRRRPSSAAAGPQSGPHRKSVVRPTEAPPAPPPHPNHSKR